MNRPLPRWAVPGEGGGSLCVFQLPYLPALGAQLEDDAGRHG